jgi:hypothetical protein
MDIAFFPGEPAHHEGLLLRALRRDLRFQYVAIAAGGGYEVVHEDGEPDGREGVTLVNPFEVPAGEDERFLAGWHGVREALASRRGYLGTRLCRDDGAGFRFVNLARWSSPLMFARALGEVDVGLPFASHPGLYLVV